VAIPDDARLKLDRAKQHIQILNSEVAHFGERDPYHEEAEFDLRGRQGDYIVRLTVDRHPPRAWSETIGDCLHNLRATLDYLVWELWVRTSGAPASPQNVQFPIEQDRHRFRSGRRQRIGGLPARAQAEIQRLQPFRASAPTQHPLWLLRELSNHDKHRFLGTIGAAVYESDEAPVRVGERHNAVVTKIIRAEGLVADGDELFRIRMQSLGPNPSLEVTVPIIYAIAFSDDGPAHGRSVVNCLEEMRLYIRDAVFPALEPFF